MSEKRISQPRESRAGAHRKKTRSAEKADAAVALPSLSAVIERDGSWFVSTCPELGVSSQGRTLPQDAAPAAPPNGRPHEK